MDKKLIANFLLKSTIPEAKKCKLPDNEVDANGFIRDCVYRAHRDVLTGRFWLKKYTGYKHDDCNKIVAQLYQNICECINRNQALNTKILIDPLYKEYGYEVEFGALQKLVNMSLKYLIILSGFCVLIITIYEKNCDCPIDSIILSHLGITDIKWTSMNKEQYNKIQDTIKEKVEKDCGNITYDFKNWQELF